VTAEVWREHSSRPSPQDLGTSRRWRRAGLVAALVVALTALPSLLASANTLDEIQRRQAQLERALSGSQGQLSSAQQRVAQAGSALNESTAEYQQATRAYLDAEAKIPGAEQALADAQAQLAAAQSALAAAQAEAARAAGELAAAQEREAAAVEALRQAEAEVAAAKERVAALGDRIVTKQKSIGQVAAEAYQRGALGDLESLTLILEADNLEQFNARVTYVQSAINAEGSAVADLQDIRASEANARVQLEEAEERARQAREAARIATQLAAEALARAQAAEAAAQQAAAEAAAQQSAAAQAAADVQALVEQRDQARVSAEQAQVADEANYRALRNEESSIQAEISALAAQVREQAAAADAERARLEAERRAREEAERRAREQAASRSSGSSSPAPAPAPAPPPPPPPPPQTTAGPLAWPVSGRMSSPYGYRRDPLGRGWRLHSGLDIAAPCGTPVRAATSGTVVWTRYLYSYGNQVMINHGMVNGAPLATSYSHLSGFAVRPGQYVSRGQVVAYIGTTGSSTGCHLHFMVYVNGSHVNPIGWL